MFNIFEGVSKDGLKSIYEDVLRSEEDGIRPKSLNSYAEKLREIYEFETFSQATSLAKKLFYKEIAKRYFANK